MAGTGTPKHVAMAYLQATCLGAPGYLPGTRGPRLRVWDRGLERFAAGDSSGNSSMRAVQFRATGFITHMRWWLRVCCHCACVSFLMSRDLEGACDHTAMAQQGSVGGQPSLQQRAQQGMDGEQGNGWRQDALLWAVNAFGASLAEVRHRSCLIHAGLLTNACQ